MFVSDTVDVDVVDAIVVVGATVVAAEAKVAAGAGGGTGADEVAETRIPSSSLRRGCEV